MILTDFLTQFIVAGAIGGLIGLEREHREDRAAVAAGIRTFPLISISGFLVAFLGQALDAVTITAAGVLGAFALSIVFMVVRQQLGLTGITTPVATIVTFLIGVIIGHGFVFEGVVVGVAATFLLVTKRHLHTFARILDDQEIISALQFITLAFILLPLTATMPRGVGGFAWIGRGAIVDPYVILLVVIFVSSISFVSLIAMRRVGPKRGLVFSGMLGGLVNSEATTAGLAQRAREQPALVAAAIAGSLLASTTMLARNVAIAAVADPTLVLAVRMFPYMVPIALVGGAFAYARQRSGKGDAEQIRVRNPFAVVPALKFAAIFAIISIAAELATDTLGELGVYMTSVGGFVSAGAVIASIASLTTTGVISLEVGLRTVLLATAASVLGKLVILWVTNREAYRRGLAPYLMMGGTSLAAAAVAFLVA